MSKYFSADELKCKCERGDKCDAVEMDMNTVMKIDGMRMEYGKALVITSAARCEQHNQKINGSPNSQHLLGKAVDIKTKGGADTLRLLHLAIKHQFVGIGIGKGFIHVDTRSGPPVLFGY